MEGTRFFNFRIGNTERNKLAELAQETGRTKAQILRELIQRAQVEPRIRIGDSDPIPAEAARIEQS